MNRTQIISIAGVLGLITIFVLNPPESSQTKVYQKPPVDIKESWEKAVESHQVKMRWKCEDAIKESLKDPRSYQANDVNYWPSMEAEPALVMVKINYTAKNSFGGAVRGDAVCHADAKGNIIKFKNL